MLSIVSKKKEEELSKNDLDLDITPYCYLLYCENYSVKAA